MKHEASINALPCSWITVCVMVRQRRRGSAATGINDVLDSFIWAELSHCEHVEEGENIGLCLSFFPPLYTCCYPDSL